MVPTIGAAEGVPFGASVLEDIDCSALMAFPYCLLS